MASPHRRVRFQEEPETAPTPDSQADYPSRYGDDDDDDDDYDDMPPLEPEREDVVVAKRPTTADGGDVVLIRGLPDVFTIGYDCVSLTARNFVGLRGVPAGTHFIWVAHPDGVSTRCGAWFVSTAGEQQQPRVHVLQWDESDEVLLVVAGAPSSPRHLTDSVYAQLVPYHDPGAGAQQVLPAGNAKAWSQLVGHVTPDALDRIVGRQHQPGEQEEQQEQQEQQQSHVGNDNRLWLVHTTDRVSGAVRLASEVELDRRMLSGDSSTMQDRELVFTFSQLSRTYTTGNSGADRTLDATDATSYMLSLLDNGSRDGSRDESRDGADGDGDGDAAAVAELQFAYTVGTLLGNDACIQQWWHMLLRLVLRAYLLPTLRPSLAASLLRTVAAQLSHSAEYLDASILDYGDAQSRDLRLALTVYKRRVDDLDPALADVARPAALALAHVESVVARPPLGWDLRGDSYARRGMATTEEGERVEVEMAELAAEDERGEWAPEIVELDDTGREKGLVSWSD
ncbi:A1 cistron-splicing factor AAR2 [Geosmithia morbida]|uniref:A1 cistron-splicing factor AAR2 n=1 Tax=Geosmithia morbida TaxID=1094350 RepID=A0A9P5D1E3_9HYPO|nr:A1 cistron-splicing factor AAR2 [Geosmithia morbida]KAF4119750.1 A1 cistron-splicing factor AAR2 [Geosmithia morbida]